MLAVEVLLLALAASSHAGRLVGGAPQRLEANTLEARISTENLATHVNQLQAFADPSPARNRLIGTSGLELTIQYILTQLQDPELRGFYNVYTQDFELRTQTRASGSLQVNGANIPLGVGQYSPSTTGPVTGRIVPVANFGCNATDYPAATRGNLALVERGSCSFADKSLRAGSTGAGALGLIVYNNVAGPANGFTLSKPFSGPNDPRAPTVGILRDQGLAIKNQIASGADITATLAVNVTVLTINTRNVLADTKGTDPDNIVVLGAHIDSVSAGPGLNDNGSGTIALIEVARQLSRFLPKTTIRFAFWSAEEEGLIGSSAYVSSLRASEVARIKAYLNFDMIASPNYVYGIYDGSGSAFPKSPVVPPPGSGSIQTLFEDFYQSYNLSFRAAEFTGRSDYGPFVRARIASGGLFTGGEGRKTAEEAADFGGKVGLPYDSNYHRAGDTKENINYEAFTVNTRAIARAVATYGMGLESMDFTKGTGKTSIKGKPSPGLSVRIIDNVLGFFGGGNGNGNGNDAADEKGSIENGPAQKKTRRDVMGKTRKTMATAPHGHHACSRDLPVI